MLDDDDANTLGLLALLLEGPWGLILLLAFIVVSIAVCGNKKECATKHCDRGVPVLTNNECLCLEKAK